MPVITAELKMNQLIAALPSEERQRILRLCDPVNLVFGTVLGKADTLLQYAYFPLTCLISLSTITSDHQPLGVAMIGNEGLLGSAMALGVHSVRLHGVVHGSGTALRLTAHDLERLLCDSRGLSSVLRRYYYVLMGQLLQTAACNSFHEVEMRLARWLLMTDDRSTSKKLHFTHQTLADLLGVQRSAVTLAAGRLKDRELIGYARGRISILSRTGLEAASCECYAAQR